MATKAEERAARQASIERSVAKDTAKRKKRASLRDAKKAETARTAAATGNKTSAGFIEKTKARLADAGGKIKKTAKELPAKTASQVRGLGARLGGAKEATTTRARKVLDKLSLRDAKGPRVTTPPPPPPSGPATLSPGSTGQVSANKQLVPTRNQLSTRVLQPNAPTKLQKLAKFGARAALPLSAAALALEASKGTTTEGRDQLQKQSGIRQASVRGFDEVEAERRQAVRDAAVGDDLGSLFGESAGDPESFKDTPVAQPGGLQAALATGVGTVRGAFGFGAEDEEPAPPPAQAGLREFTNVDAREAAAGINPQSRRGTASLEQNQTVIDRLIARNQGLRAQQLAQSQAAPGVGRQAEGSAAATQAANQASGGGLASAFGALALSGNQLRRQAAERGREFAASETAADAQNTIQNTLAGQSARFQALDQAAQNRVTDDIQGFTKQLSDFRERGDTANTERFLDTTFSQAINDPGATGAQLFAQQEAAKEIRDLVGRGFFNAFKFSTERGLIDWFMGLGQGGQSEPLLLADGRSFMTINPSTGMLEIQSPDGATRQVLDNPQDLSPRVQELMKSIAPQASGRTVGPPQDHPQNLRDLQLRQ